MISVTLSELLNSFYFVFNKNMSKNFVDSCIIFNFFASFSFTGIKQVELRKWEFLIPFWNFSLALWKLLT